MAWKVPRTKRLSEKGERAELLRIWGLAKADGRADQRETAGSAYGTARNAERSDGKASPLWGHCGLEAPLWGCN